MFWKIINFVIFVGVLTYFLRKPLREFWLVRRSQLALQIEEATKLAREAGEKHASYEKRLSHIEKEAQQLVAELKNDGELQKKQILKESKEWELSMNEEWKKIAAQEIRKAKIVLQKEAVQLAAEIAEKLVHDHFEKDDQVKLTEGYLKRLEAQS
ncbi:MAG: ATP synthase F0 subunit B [Deltaproteobacteria bacterium]|nr:ATP synthase F0 subunit B [Deltaproteobacteria bacterium]